MKYHKDQKVIVLPSAMEIAVGECSINKVGTVVAVYRITPRRHLYDYSIEVPCVEHGHGCTHQWGVRECDIKPEIAVGQQLLLWDDVDENG